MLERLAHEPAVIIGVITAGVQLLVAFGVPVSDDQQAAIKTFAEAAIGLIGILLIRMRVSPVEA